MQLPMTWFQAFVSNILRALNLVWRCSRNLTVASVIIVLIQSLLPLAGLYLMKRVVDEVTAQQQISFRRVAFLIGLSAAIALLEILCTSIANIIRASQSRAITDHMYDVLHAKSVEVDLEYYENSSYYDKLHRFQQESSIRPNRILSNLLQVAQSGLSLLTMVGLIISIHWSIAIFLILAAVPGLWVQLKHAEKMFSWEREQTPLERQSWYFSSLLTHDYHAKEIRLFDLGSLFVERFRRLREQLGREKLDLLRRRSISQGTADGVSTVTAFAVYAFTAYRALQGLITVGDLVMFYQAVLRARTYVNEFLSSMASLYDNNLFLSNVYEFLDLKPKVTEPIRPKVVPRPMRVGIVFQHVSFQYPSDTRKVLDDINLTIRPGEHIALVGENGAGKTTLIKLLCRLYDVTEGAITFDGIELTDFPLGDLRREISVIFQDYARYHLTVRDNVWFGNIHFPPQDERIVEAARQAGAHEVIAGLKNGYETILGKWFANGEELSIGEWQKIALARAFLRQAQIIVLDEPTSSMDARAEYEVFERFHQLSKDRTAILISHRLSTVRMADSIYVLENGRIVESGTHDDLVYRGGKYASLFKTQAQSYR